MAWYEEITADQWKAFFAAYLGWVLDGFDFYILAFLLTDIQRTARSRMARHAVDRRSAGAARALDHVARARESGLARAPASARRRSAPRPVSARAAFQSIDRARDAADVAPHGRVSVFQSIDH